MPGLYPKSVSPSGRPIPLCVLAAGAVKTAKVFCVVEEGDSSRLDALGALLVQAVARLVCTGLVRRVAHQHGLDYRTRNIWRDARIGFYHGTKSVFEIAITVSTWLIPIDHEDGGEGRVGSGSFCSMFPVCGSGMSRCPGRGQGQGALTDQTVEAGGLVPRCNEVGRKLGGRDKDKMTDCPMVLALTLWRAKLGMWPTHFRPLPRRRRYYHAQHIRGLFLMSD